MLKKFIIALAITSLSTSSVNAIPNPPTLTAYNIEDDTLLVCDEEYELIDYIIALQCIRPC